MSKKKLLLLLIQKIAFRINSRHTSSLGLHPAVYFYSSLGMNILLSHGPAILLVCTKNSALIVGQKKHQEYVFFRRVLGLFWMSLNRFWRHFDRIFFRIITFLSYHFPFWVVCIFLMFNGPLILLSWDTISSIFHGTTFFDK